MSRICAQYKRAETTLVLVLPTIDYYILKHDKFFLSFN
ncbi:MAG: Hypothetical protein LKU_00061 [Lactobacillus kefiranofaciens]